MNHHTNFLRLIAVFLLLPALGPARALAQGTTDKRLGQDQVILLTEADLPEGRFDLDFPGGTISQLVDAARKASKEPLNIVDSAFGVGGNATVPSLELKSVTFGGIVEFLTPSLMVQPGRPQFHTTAEGWVLVSQPDPSAQEKPKVHTYVLDEILESVKLEDLLALITKSIALTGTKTQPELQFHEETQTLIGLLTKDHAEILDSLVRQFAAKSQGRFSSRQTDELSKLLGEEKDKARHEYERAAQRLAEIEGHLKEQGIEDPSKVPKVAILKTELEQAKAHLTTILAEESELRKTIRNERIRR